MSRTVHEESFQQVKKLVETTPVLRPLDYDSKDPIYLFTDASQVGAGAWVGQGPTPETAQPAAFHSRKFATSQLHYPVHELELLAIVDAVQAFHPLLSGVTFTIMSDNKSLSYFMRQTNLGNRLTRWRMFLQHYDFTIVHTAGKDNALADALSRIYEERDAESEAELMADPTIRTQESAFNNMSPSDLSAPSSPTFAFPHFLPAPTNSSSSSELSEIRSEFFAPSLPSPSAFASCAASLHTATSARQSALPPVWPSSATPQARAIQPLESKLSGPTTALATSGSFTNQAQTSYPHTPTPSVPGPPALAAQLSAAKTLLAMSNVSTSKDSTSSIRSNAQATSSAPQALAPDEWDQQAFSFCTALDHATHLVQHYFTSLQRAPSQAEGTATKEALERVEATLSQLQEALNGLGDYQDERWNLIADFADKLKRLQLKARSLHLSTPSSNTSAPRDQPPYRANTVPSTSYANRTAHTNPAFHVAMPSCSAAYWKACNKDHCLAHIKDKIANGSFPVGRSYSQPISASNTPMIRPTPPSHAQVYSWTQPDDIIDPRTARSIFCPRPAANWIRESMANHMRRDPRTYSTDMLREPYPPSDGPDDFSEEGEDEGVHLRYFQLQDHLKTQWYQAIKEATRTDPLLEATEKAWEEGQESDFNIGDDILYKFGPKDVVYIPPHANLDGNNLRNEVMRLSHHHLAHLGPNRCYDYAKVYFYWNSMRQDFVDFCCRCHLCQVNKVSTRLPEGEPRSLPIPEAPFESLAIDFAGPFPSDQKCELICVILDRFS